MDWCPEVELETFLNLFSASPMNASDYCANTGILQKSVPCQGKYQYGKSQNTNNMCETLFEQTPYF